MAEKILGFTLDEACYALHLNAVVRVIHAVEIRFLPGAPEIISGIINVQGQIIPVINIRKRLKLPVREIHIDDQIIIADTGKRIIAIVVDSVTGVSDLTTGQKAVANDTLPFAEHLSGVAKSENGLILIYDLERFLTLGEEKLLSKVLKLKKNDR